MQDFFEGVEHWHWVAFYGTNNLIYGTLTATHYFTLFVLVGTAIAMDLRLLNIVGAGQQIANFADEIFPWIWTAMGFVLFSGSMLWLVTGGDYVMSPAMNGKLAIVFLAILGTILIRIGVRRWDAAPDAWNGIAGGFVVFSALVLWLSPASYYWRALPSHARTVVGLVVLAVAVVVWLIARTWGKPSTAPAAAKILAISSVVLFILAILGGNNIAALCGLG